MEAARIQAHNQYRQHTDDFIKEKLGFLPTCPYEVLMEQKEGMRMYLHTLEVRAAMENINLDLENLTTNLIKPKNLV